MDNAATWVKVLDMGDRRDLGATFESPTQIGRESHRFTESCGREGQRGWTSGHGTDVL